MFRYMNANPMGKQIEDCTVRAISVAENISWDEAYRKLSNAARIEGLMMDSAEFIEKYLNKKYKKICYHSKTVEEFMEEYPTGTFLITMPRSYNSCKRRFFI